MKISRFIIISRPALWPWIFLPYLVGIGNVGNFTAFSLTEFLFFLFPLNFFLYGINDIYDKKSDEINPRKGGLQGAILKEDEIAPVKLISFAIAATFLILAGFSGNWKHVFFVLVFLLASFSYSHSSIRFKEIPFLDSIIGGPVIYLSPILIAFSLNGSISDLSPQLFLLTLPLIGFHAGSTLKDAEYDAGARMQSTGIFLGRKNTLIFALLLIALPLIFFILAGDPFLTAILGVTAAWTSFLAFSKLKYDNELLTALIATFVFCWVTTLLYYFLRANW